MFLFPKKFQSLIEVGDKFKSIAIEMPEELKFET